MSAAVMALVPFLRGFDFVWRPTISADVTNWNLKTQALAAGWDGVVPLDAIVTVGSGIFLSANAVGAFGFDTGAGFPDGTKLKLVMPGFVCGMGGAGGNGFPGNAFGQNGGPALRAQYWIDIDALGGVIAGGGGGGGSGRNSNNSSLDSGGGGGRGGRVNSAGGAGTYEGWSGNVSSGGDGGSSYGGAGGTTGPGGDGTLSGAFGGGSSTYGGGGGGGWGAAGGRGRTNIGGSGDWIVGGGAGAAVVGNAYITWINTGTRYGAIT